MLFWLVMFLGAGDSLAQSGGFNQACQIINSLPCSQTAQTPVCASNGVLYNSECLFAKEQCKDPSLHADASGSKCITTTMPPITNATMAPDNSTMPSNSTIPSINSTMLPNNSTPVADNSTTVQTGSPMTTVEMMSTLGVNLTTITLPPFNVNMTTTQTMDSNMTMPTGNHTTMMPMPMNSTAVSSMNVTDGDGGSMIGSSTTSPAMPMTTILTLEPTQTTAATTTPMASTTIVTKPTQGLSTVCKIILASECSVEYSPVCAIGLVEYDSLCAFTHAQCYDPTLTIIHRGPCQGTTTKLPSVEDIICETILQNPCNDDGVVLCGTDGITYSNSCVYEKQRCVHPELKVAKPGKC